MTHQRVATHVAAKALKALAEEGEIGGVEGDVLHRMVTMLLGKAADLRFFLAVDALDEHRPEGTMVHAPDGHGRFAIGEHIVDARNQSAALDLYVIPRPL